MDVGRRVQGGEMKPKPRTDYHREHYAKNAQKRREQKNQANDDFDLAVSYWRQKTLFNRDLPNLIARVSDSIVERARIHYEKVNAEFGI